MNNQSPITAAIARRNPIQINTTINGNKLESTDYSRALQYKFETLNKGIHKETYRSAIKHLEQMGEYSPAMQQMTFDSYASTLSLLMGIN